MSGLIVLLASAAIIARRFNNVDAPRLVIPLCWSIGPVSFYSPTGAAFHFSFLSISLLKNISTSRRTSLSLANWGSPLSFLRMNYVYLVRNNSTACPTWKWKGEKLSNCSQRSNCDRTLNPCSTKLQLLGPQSFILHSLFSSGFYFYFFNFFKWLHYLGK